MTRETKVGLVVAASFLGLVGVVVAARMRNAQEPATSPAVATKITPGKPAATQGDKSPAPANPGLDKKPPSDSPLAPVTFKPNPLPPGLSGNPDPLAGGLPPIGPPNTIKPADPITDKDQKLAFEKLQSGLKPDGAGTPPSAPGTGLPPLETKPLATGPSPLPPAPVPGTGLPPLDTKPPATGPSPLPPPPTTASPLPPLDTPGTKPSPPVASPSPSPQTPATASPLPPLDTPGTKPSPPVASPSPSPPPPSTASPLPPLTTPMPATGPMADPKEKSFSPLDKHAGSIPVVRIPPSDNPPQPLVYDVKTYTCEPGETTFAQVSKKLYGHEKYGRALWLFNRDYNPMAGENLRKDPPQFMPRQALSYPPEDILRSRYGSAIGDGTSATPPAPVTIGIKTPTPLTSGPGNPNTVAFPPPGTSVGPADGVKLYRVRDGGEHILQIAQAALGDRARWPEINRLNPSLDPRYPYPAGIEIRLPGNARVP